ncbi:MAG: hypothetical protein NZ530_07230 [Thermodesulfobacteriaceae bacterium]|nr:hypothetical protein [Thermodesulfobacteriaceae bacterium]MDW8136441.1 hypothetical protein [Thermodesulfobacterium sp.]
MKIPKVPTCPFCRRFIGKPTYLSMGVSDFEAGKCECGSVYVCDVTGHNRGAAFVEALLMACAGDWDLVWELVPEEDYQEIWIENYDFSTHRIFGDSFYEGRRISGVLCFIKLAKDLEELKSKEKESLFRKKEAYPKIEKRKLSKLEMEKFIENLNYSELIAYHLSEPLNLNLLQRFLYHPDPIFRKKVILVLGKIAEKMVEIYPEKVLELIKRLIYASVDSASSAWGALEAVGEIISTTKERFGIFVRNLLAFLDLEEWRLLGLYALLRIAQNNPQVLKKERYLKLLRYLKENETPEVKALVLLIFYHLRTKEILSYLPFIKEEEQAELFNYQTLNFEKIFLKDLANQIKTSF